MEYPLKDNWSLWYNSFIYNDDYKDIFKNNKKCCGNIRTLSSFWAVWKEIIKPSQLTQNTSFHFSNPKTGTSTSITITIREDSSDFDIRDINRIWLLVCLVSLGNIGGYGRYIKEISIFKYRFFYEIVVMLASNDKIDHLKEHEEIYKKIKQEYDSISVKREFLQE
jgi:hypothetical protein